MLFRTNLRAIRSLVLACLFGALIPARAPGASWKPITPEDLAAAPRLDPETGIEVLFREVTIDDSNVGETVYRNYVRMKVFNERGVAALDKIELPGTREVVVRNIAARVIKPDGTIIPVSAKAVYDRDVVRSGSFKVKVRAFSLPALTVGCLVEYMWDEIAMDDSGGLHGLRLRFQGKYPVRRVAFRLRPSPYISDRYRLQTVRCNGASEATPKTSIDGYAMFELTDVPAFEDEPRMPPDLVVEAWLLLYYRKVHQTDDEYWVELGQEIGATAAKRIRPDTTVQAKAQELVAGAASTGEKVERLYEFCRTQISNIDEELVLLDPKALKKRGDRTTNSEVLTSRRGTSSEIRRLFLALASAAGFPACVARAPDRSVRFFDPKETVPWAISDELAAVKVDGAWKLLDPGAGHLPYGRLHWRNEALSVLICDPKKPEWIRSPYSGAADSRVVRRAVLALDEEGTLTGKVTLEFAGHPEYAKKVEYRTMSAEAASEAVCEDVHERLGTAEISNVVVENASDPVKPMNISYEVRVPEYAERTGTRLMFMPAYFQKGQDPMFKSEKRTHPIYFPYRFINEDNVQIELPAGYTLEEASSPHSLGEGETFGHESKVAVTKNGRKVIARRKLRVDSLYFLPDVYAPLKAVTDEVHASDQHMLVIKRADEAAAVVSP